MFRVSVFCLLAACIVPSLSPAQRLSFEEDHGRCEPITIPLCKDIKYNMTIFPNLLNHQKQDDASTDVHMYVHLIKVKCSPDLQFFLCTVYAPVCTVLSYPIPPCRPLCDRVRAGCGPIMERFGFRWPEKLSCEQYPLSPSEKICVGNETGPDDEGGGYNRASGSSFLAHAPLSPYGPRGGIGLDAGVGSVFGGSEVFGRLEPPLLVGGNPTRSNLTKNHGFLCPKEFSVPHNLEYVVKIGGKEVKHCGMPCYHMFFRGHNLQLARYWIGGLAIVSAASTLFTVCTYLIETRRFPYPERPIIFLSLCNLMVAIVYIVGFALDKSVACNAPFPSPNGERNIRMESTIAQNNKKEACTIMFTALYFFSMSGAIWWLVLTLAWFLASGLKWSQEAIESISHYFHLFAWTLPAVKTIIVLALGRMEGDLLSGVCYVGVWNMDALRNYVLFPTMLYVLLGVGFIVAGFASLCQIRTALMKVDASKTDKLERLIGRIGLFSLLYLLPTLTVLGCLFYEQANMDRWLLSWQWDVHREGRWSMTCPEAPCFPREKYNAKYNHRPEFAVFMVKYLGILIVGVSSGVWVWSRKTFATWKLFLMRVCCCFAGKQPREVYV